jgi:radical SAM modification target selenobiotic family peptide
MDKQDLKKVLAGISMASLLTGAVMGCAPQSQQSAPPSKETVAPAQKQEIKTPGQEAPAPSS